MIWRNGLPSASSKLFLFVCTDLRLARVNLGLIMIKRGAALATGCTATIQVKTPLLNLNQNSVLGIIVIVKSDRSLANTFLVGKEFSHIATVACGMTAAEADDNGSFSTDFVSIFLR